MNINKRHHQVRLHNAILPELLTATALTSVLLVWALFVNVPILKLASPGLSDSTLTSRWYAIGLKEILLYFDPLFAGILMPAIIISSLMIIIYADWNAYKKRPDSLAFKKMIMSHISLGFTMWLLFILAGHIMIDTEFSSPGKVWSISTCNGLFCIMSYFTAGMIIPLLTGRNIYAMFGLKKYALVTIMILLIYTVPLKILLRLAFDIQYVLVTPWFNV